MIASLNFKCLRELSLNIFCSAFVQNIDTVSFEDICAACPEALVKYNNKYYLTSIVIEYVRMRVVAVSPNGLALVNTNIQYGIPGPF